MLIHNKKWQTCTFIMQWHKKFRIIKIFHENGIFFISSSYFYENTLFPSGIYNHMRLEFSSAHKVKKITLRHHPPPIKEQTCYHSICFAFLLSKSFFIELLSISNRYNSRGARGIVSHLHLFIFKKRISTIYCLIVMRC